MPKTFLITGSSGIGAATAMQLAGRASADTQVFFTSLHTQGCDELEQALAAKGATSAHLVGDLMDAAFVPLVARTCIDRFGRIDSLFNVAGGSGRKYGDGPLHLCTDDGWNRTLDLNLTTQFRMAREVVRAMLQQDVVEGLRGTILNMSSILALHPEPQHFDTIAYAASKAATLGMTRTMAASYATQRINVNAVAPGLVKTTMSRRASEDAEVLRTVRRRQRLTDGMIPIDDVARTCAGLLDGSASTTGQCILIDGGWSLFE